MGAARFSGWSLGVSDLRRIKHNPIVPEGTNEEPWQTDTVTATEVASRPDQAIFVVTCRIGRAPKIVHDKGRYCALKWKLVKTHEKAIADLLCD